MKKFGTKFVAVAAATAMTLALAPINVFADTTYTETLGGEDTTSGTAKVEGYIDNDVVRLVLPTDAEKTAMATSLSFKLDPQSLLNQSGTEGFDEGTLYFTNTGDSTTYSNTSDALTVTSKCNFDVDVSVTATASDLTDTVTEGGGTIALASKPEFETDDTSASLYLGLIVDSDAAVALDSTTLKATATKTLTGLADTTDNYTVVKQGDKYVKTLASDDVEGKSTTFKLTGACNPKGDWSKVTSATPKVTLSWSVDKHVDKAAPSIAKTATFTKGEKLTIDANLGKGDLAATKIASVTAGSSATGSFAAVTGISTNGTSVTMAGTVFSGASAGDKRYLKVVFNDTAKTAVIIEVTVAVAATTD